MRSFVAKHSKKIVGTLSCFDRIIFRGHLPLQHSDAMESLLKFRGVPNCEWDKFVKTQSGRLQEHAKRTASQSCRPYIYLNRYTRKEELVEKIIQQDHVTSGLVCVLAALEAVNSYALRYGNGKPRLVRAPRRTLVVYYYFIDREFGLMHIRLETWFPLTIQICINGHHWLARKLDRHGIKHTKVDNAFTSFDDFSRAQRFADTMTDKNWPRVLDAFAQRVNPLLKGLLSGIGYYWVTDQAEYSTDIVFDSSASLQPLYARLLRHATLCFSAEDVMTFLGRKLHPLFKGDVITDCKKRLPGARVKHRVSQNWIKMYDKFGVVLRVETVINSPKFFVVRRYGTRKGERLLGWFPLRKGVAFFPRYRDIALAANHRYLNALVCVSDPAAAYRQIDALCEPVLRAGRRRRALSPLSPFDRNLFRAVLRGEHAINGFRNRDLVRRLFPDALIDPASATKASARVTRLLQLLHAHRLIAKIPRSRRYRLTQQGIQVMSATLWLNFEHIPDLLGRLSKTG
jgi:hypothetical protein